MVKRRLQKLILTGSIALIFCGCGYKFLAIRDRPVFCVLPVVNETLQPEIDLYLAGEIRKAFLGNPGFDIVGGKAHADYLLAVRLKDLQRRPLFYMPGDARDIIVAKFYVEADIEVLQGDKVLMAVVLSEFFSFPLDSRYDESSQLEALSKDLARNIYHMVLDRYVQDKFR